MEQNPQKPRINGLTGKALQALKKEYIIVGKRHIQGWHIWLFLCIFTGVTTGIAFVANRSGEVEPTQVAPIAAIDVTVYGNQSLGPFKLLQGFIHGITYQIGTNYSSTIEKIDALKPQNWRISNFINDVYEFVVTEANYPGRFGTKIVFVVDDAFINSKNDSFVILDPSCPPANSTDNCFATFDEMKTEWANFIDLMMQPVITQQSVTHYFDIFNEPEPGTSGKMRGLSSEQFLELFRLAHNGIRVYGMPVKIVAPSIADYDKVALEGFLTYVINNNLRLDALSWHEFNWSGLNTTSPEVVPVHVNEMRQFFSEHPQLCNPACPEIHINEYAGENHFVPGWAVGWLYYLGLGQTNVDVANRACWDVWNGTKDWSNCWAGINGMLMDDNVTPQAIYWVHKFYADLLGSIQLKTTSTHAKTVAIAGKINSENTLGVMVGRYGGVAGGAANVNVVISKYPYTTTGSKKVKVQLWRVPKPTLSAEPLLSPIELPARTISITEGTVSFSMLNFVDGDAYLIVIKPL
ncbi:MAG: hypothetical protein A3D65_00140 [Candidatus Lloydbacteria bacterium RIFCSPHIGHO2_02_FULL_50_13]|uniref:Glycoside hydrolase family 5 domain-containing protein n=1 Tax=Candidatus Lloydbacteria bacterium RIFCSPHIGHO2_02_FULL_50_13 TaxID=1798661 RepID=A0A1G2D272_9BACT|nr:MAG: hypothetical protein A3D65_00140 [Candidatus Lloydbacteria bacterium RIFCSPHIGHO2_02_FULL_50_13]